MKNCDVADFGSFCRAIAIVPRALRRPLPEEIVDRLASLVSQHVERLTSGPYDLWFVVGLAGDESHRFPSVARKASDWRHAVAGLVREGIDRGELQPVDVTLAVAAISGLVYAALQLRHQQGRVEPAAIARLAVASLARR